MRKNAEVEQRHLAPEPGLVRTGVRACWHGDEEKNDVLGACTILSSGRMERAIDILYFHGYFCLYHKTRHGDLMGDGVGNESYCSSFHVASDEEILHCNAHGRSRTSGPSEECSLMPCFEVLIAKGAAGWTKTVH